MTLMVLGGVLVGLSLAGLIGYGVRRFFTELLSEVETERTDLAQDANRCTQTLSRYVR